MQFLKVKYNVTINSGIKLDSYSYVTAVSAPVNPGQEILIYIPYGITPEMSDNGLFLLTGTPLVYNMTTVQAKGLGSVPSKIVIANESFVCGGTYYGTLKADDVVADMDFSGSHFDCYIFNGVSQIGVIKGNKESGDYSTTTPVFLMWYQVGHVDTSDSGLINMSKARGYCTINKYGSPVPVMAYISAFEDDTSLNVALTNSTLEMMNPDALGKFLDKLQNSQEIMSKHWINR